MNPLWRRTPPPPQNSPSTNTSEEQPISVQWNNALVQRHGEPQRGNSQRFESYPVTQTRSGARGRGSRVISSVGTSTRGKRHSSDPDRSDNPWLSTFDFDSPPVPPSNYWNSLERRQQEIEAIKQRQESESQGLQWPDNLDPQGPPRAKLSQLRTTLVPPKAPQAPSGQQVESTTSNFFPRPSDAAIDPSLEPILRGPPVTALAPLNSRQPESRSLLRDPSPRGGLPTTVTVLQGLSNMTPVTETQQNQVTLAGLDPPPGQSNITPATEEHPKPSGTYKSPYGPPSGLDAIRNRYLGISTPKPTHAHNARPNLPTPPHSSTAQPGQNLLGGNDATPSQAAQGTAREASLPVQQHANPSYPRLAPAPPFVNNNFESTDEETPNPHGSFNGWELDSLAVYRVWLRRLDYQLDSHLFIETNEKRRQKNSDGAYCHVRNRHSDGRGRYYIKHIHSNDLDWAHCPPPEEWSWAFSKGNPFGFWEKFARKEPIGWCPKGMVKYIAPTLERVMGPKDESDMVTWNRAWVEKAIKRLKKHHCLEPL